MADIQGQTGQLGEILKGLIKLSGQVGESTFNRATGPNSAIGLISQLIGQSSSIPDQQKLDASTKGTRTEGLTVGEGGLQAKPGFDEKSLPPLQQEALKTAKKIQKQQMEEAAMGGVPLENMLQTAGLPTEAITGITTQTQALTGQVQPQQAQTIIPKEPSFLGFKQHPAIRSQILSNIIKEQQIKGEQPLQKGDKQKIELEQYYKLAEGATKPMSSEAAKTLGNVDSGLKQIQALENAFTQDPNIFKTGSFSETGQVVNTMVDDLTDILGRLRSGGAINADEFKSFRRQIPSKGPIKGRIERPASVKLKIQKLKELFQQIKQSVAPESGTGISANIQKARQAGYSDEQIMEALKSRGVL